MPKTPSVSASSSKKSASKMTKAGDDGKEKKERKPSVYQAFMKREMAIYKTANPGTPPTAVMKEVAALWKESDENVNKGKPSRTRKKKVAEGLPESSSSAPSSSQPASVEPSSDF